MVFIILFDVGLRFITITTILLISGLSRWITGIIVPVPIRRLGVLVPEILCQLGVLVPIISAFIISVRLHISIDVI